MRLRVSIAAGWVAAVCIAAGGQTVTFNTPTEWMTLGDAQVVAKTLLDTAGIEGKRVTLTLVKVDDGRRRVLAHKTYAVSDYSEEFTLGRLAGSVIGGTDYLKIEWSVPGKENDKGTLEPFGYVQLDEAAIPIVLKPREFTGGITPESVKAVAAQLEYGSVADCAIAAVWNKKALGLVFKGSPDSGSITVAFDGKNGKNAFLAYSDWFVTSGSGDSLKAYHHTRKVTDEGIEYQEQPWRAGAEKIVGEEITLVILPWHDLGVVPFVDRRFGLAAFAADAEGKPLGALPEDAVRDIPGTWGDCELRDSEGKRSE